MGPSGDLAGAALFLASRATDYMHGAVVPVDAGPPKQGVAPWPATA